MLFSALEVSSKSPQFHSADLDGETARVLVCGLETVSSTKRVCTATFRAVRENWPLRSWHQGFVKLERC